MAGFPRESESAGTGEHKNTFAGVVVQIVCIVLILIGVAFRFTALDRKFVTCDEVNTNIVVAGYKDRPPIYDRYITAQSLLKYRQFCPDSTVIDTLDLCRLKTPYNPPLFFVSARLWHDVLGGDETTPRFLSALIDVLSIPLFYFLSLELFPSTVTASIISALAAVSPFNLEWARFPRPYSLWMVFTLLSSILLLRAGKRGGRSWVAYVVATILALYTHLSALRVLLGHVIYGCTQKFFDRKFKLSGLLLSVIVSLIAFVPWAIELNAHLDGSWKGLGWFGVRDSDQALWQVWSYQISEIFIDSRCFSPDVNQILLPVVLLTELALVILFIRRAPAASRNFLLVMCCTTFTSLALPDLFLGGNRSTQTRYMMPLLFSLEMMLGFSLSAMAQSKNKLVARSGIFLLVITLTTELFSCATVLQSKTWHGWGIGPIEASRIINRCKKPILLGWKKPRGWSTDLISWATVLRGDVILAFSTSDDLLPVPKGVTNVFVLEPTPQQLERLNGSNDKYVQRCRTLWELTEK